MAGNETFKEWLVKNGVEDYANPLHFYDYEAAYKAKVDRNNEGHFPSKFKDDLHPNRYIKTEDGSIWDTKYNKSATQEDIIMQVFNRTEFLNELDFMVKENASRYI